MIPGWFAPSGPAVDQTLTVIDPQASQAEADLFYPIPFLRNLLNALSAVTTHPKLLKLAQFCNQLTDDHLDINFIRFATPVIHHIVYSDEKSLIPLREKLNQEKGLYHFLLTPLVVFQGGVWNTYRYDQEKALLASLKLSHDGKVRRYQADRRELTSYPYTPELFIPLRGVQDEIMRDEHDYLLRSAYLEIYRKFIANQFYPLYDWMPIYRYLNPCPYHVKLDPKLTQMKVTYYFDYYASDLSRFWGKGSTSTGLLKMKIGPYTQQCRFNLFDGDERINGTDLKAIEMIMLKALKMNAILISECTTLLHILNQTPVPENRDRHAFLTGNDYNQFKSIHVRTL